MWQTVKPRKQKQILGRSLPIMSRIWVAGGGTLDAEDPQQGRRTTGGPPATAQDPVKSGVKRDGSLALEATPSMLLPAPDAPLLVSHIGTAQRHASNGTEPAVDMADLRQTAAANGGVHLSSRPESAEAAGLRQDGYAAVAAERRDALSDSLRSLASAVSDASEHLAAPPELSDSFSQRWRAEEQRVSASSTSEQEQVCSTAKEVRTQRQTVRPAQLTQNDQCWGLGMAHTLSPGQQTQGWTTRCNRTQQLYVTLNIASLLHRCR